MPNLVSISMRRAASIALFNLFCATAVAADGYIGASAIVSLVERSLLAMVQDSSIAHGTSRVEVVAGKLDSRLRFPVCAHAPEVTADISKGHDRVNARVSCPAPEPWAIYVPVDIHAYRPVVVTTRAFEHGDRISPDDVTLEERDILGLDGNALLRLEDVIGQSIRRTVRANSPITASLIELPMLVRRGDKVALSAGSGGISVRTTGLALEAGRVGDQIRVKNIQSSRVIEARVTGPDAVEVM